MTADSLAFRSFEPLSRWLLHTRQADLGDGLAPVEPGSVG